MTNNLPHIKRLLKLYLTNEPHGEKNLHCMGLENSELLCLTRNVNYAIEMVSFILALSVYIYKFVHEFGLLINMI